MPEETLVDVVEALGLGLLLFGQQRVVVLIHFPEGFELDVQMGAPGFLDQFKNGITRNLAYLFAEVIHCCEGVQEFAGRKDIRDDLDLGVVDLDVGSVFLVVRNEALQVEVNVDVGVEVVVLERLKVLVYLINIPCALSFEEIEDSHETFVLFDFVFAALILSSFRLVSHQDLQRRELIRGRRIEVIDCLLFSACLHVEIEVEGELPSPLVLNFLVLKMLVDLSKQWAT